MDCFKVPTLRLAFRWLNFAALLLLGQKSSDAKLILPSSPKFQVVGSSIGGIVDSAVTLTIPRGQYHCTLPTGIVLNHPQAVLILEAGVEVYFPSNARIRVEAGVLDIRGSSTPTDDKSQLVVLANTGGSIFETPEDNADTWGGIEFVPHETSLHGTIFGCRIICAGVNILKSHVTMSNVRIDGGTLVSTACPGAVDWRHVTVRTPPSLAEKGPGLLVQESRGSVRLARCKVRGASLEIYEPLPEAQLISIIDTTVLNAAASGIRIIARASSHTNVLVANTTVANCGISLGSYGNGDSGTTSVVTPPPVNNGGIGILAGLVIIVSPSSSRSVVVSGSSFRRNQPSSLWIDGANDVEVSDCFFKGTLCFRRPPAHDTPTPPPSEEDVFRDCDDQDAPTAGILGLTGFAIVRDNIYEENDTARTLSLQAVAPGCIVSVSRNVLRLNSGIAGLHLSSSAASSSQPSVVNVVQNRFCGDEAGRDIRLGSDGLDVAAEANIFGGCCGSSSEVSEINRIDQLRVYDDDEESRLPAVHILPPSANVPISGVPNGGECPESTHSPTRQPGGGFYSGGGISTLTCSVQQAIFESAQLLCEFSLEDGVFDNPQELTDETSFGGMTLDGDKYYLVATSGNLPRMYTVEMQVSEDICKARIMDVCFFQANPRMDLLSGISPGPDGNIFLLFTETIEVNNGETTTARPVVGEFDTNCQELTHRFSRFELPDWYGGNNDGTDISNAPYDDHGLKSLTTQPNGKFVWTGTEQALQEDYLSGEFFHSDDRRPSRILQLSVEDRRAVGEFIYVNDPVPPEFAENGLVELLSVDDAGTAFALERAVNADGDAFGIRLYETNFHFGTINVLGMETVQDFDYIDSAPKKLVFDLEQDFGVTPSNIQAMGFAQMRNNTLARLVLAGGIKGGASSFVAVEARMRTASTGHVLAQTLYNDIPSHVPQGDDRIFLKRRSRAILEKHIPDGQCNKILNKCDEMKQFLNVCPTGVHEGCCISLTQTINSIQDWTSACC